jgi:hypothetical protein
MMEWATKPAGCDADTGLNVGACKGCWKFAARCRRIASNLCLKGFPKSDSKGAFIIRAYSDYDPGVLKVLGFRAWNGRQELPVYIEQPSSVCVTTQGRGSPLEIAKAV